MRSIAMGGWLSNGSKGNRLRLCPKIVTCSNEDEPCSGEGRDKSQRCPPNARFFETCFDTIIDVHTHPFTQTGVAFSATDDGDERTFFRFLKKTFEGMHYASIVFSQRKYSARVWTVSSGSLVARKALLKTQTSPENIASADFHEYTDERYEKTAVTG